MRNTVTDLSAYSPDQQVVINEFVVKAEELAELADKLSSLGIFTIVTQSSKDDKYEVSYGKL